MFFVQVRLHNKSKPLISSTYEYKISYSKVKINPVPHNNSCRKPITGVPLRTFNDNTYFIVTDQASISFDSDRKHISKTMYKLKFTFFFLFILLTSLKVNAQLELPGTVITQNKLIPAGSLIIAMDTLNQKLPGYFNLKAYGLANALLQNEIPILWAIKANKAKNAIDFTASASRVFPDTVAAVSLSFRSGPFIIDTNWVDEALPIIAAFGGNVAVYKLTSNATIDIRYTLTHKPKIALVNSSGFDTITVHVLQEAGFSAASYQLFTPLGQIFNPYSSYSLVSDSHFTGGDTAHINPIYRYVTNQGGNAIAQCAALGAFENNSFAMTTLGIDSAITGIAATGYFNNDQAIAQIHGNLITPQGEYKFWALKPGSVIRANAYQVIRGTGGPQHYIVTAAKYFPNAQRGGNLFYLPGHDYYFYTAPTGGINDANRINGRRMFLNSVFVPPSASIPDIDFTTDVKISITAAAGLAVKYEPFCFTIVATNIGTGKARNVKIDALLPAGLLYSSAIKTRGAYNPISGIWNLDSLASGESDTLIVTTLINQLGNITYNTNIITTSLEYVIPNNSASVTVFGVSRPDAKNDTLYFPGPVSFTYFNKANDIDEDGGPYGNFSIVAGPFRGTAAITHPDSIQYTLTATSWFGTDSLQYVTCDQYPLCDTAWMFFTIPSPLPVSLIGFEGKRHDGVIDLLWHTLSEKDNAYFAIEKSIEGQLFTEMGRVKGAGNSNDVLSYSYRDTDTGESYLYYRLRQVDYDGRNSPSNILVLPLKNRKDLSLTLYPNPSSGELIVLKATGLRETATFRITDMQGRIILMHQLNPDNNGMILDFIKESNLLESGCYIATVTSEEKHISVRLIIR